MSRIKSYEDLRVYQLSIQHLEEIYDVAYKIPHLNLRTQLIKSGEAVPPLIAEGFAKQRNPKEAARFYEMAMAESDEVSVHLTKSIILAKKFPSIPIELCTYLKGKYKSLSKQLNRLSYTWRSYLTKN